MKLFNTLSAVAVVSAQFNDFANLNDLFASLQADLGAVTVTNNANEAAATEDVADVSVSLRDSFKQYKSLRKTVRNHKFNMLLIGSEVPYYNHHD